MAFLDGKSSCQPSAYLPAQRHHAYHLFPSPQVSMAFLGVVGVPGLLAWDEGVAREALGMLCAIVTEHVHKWNGYLVGGEWWAWVGALLVWVKGRDGSGAHCGDGARAEVEWIPGG